MQSTSMNITMQTKLIARFQDIADKHGVDLLVERFAQNHHSPWKDDVDIFFQPKGEFEVMLKISGHFHQGGMFSAFVTLMVPESSSSSVVTFEDVLPTQQDRILHLLTSVEQGVEGWLKYRKNRLAADHVAPGELIEPPLPTPGNTWRLKMDDTLLLKYRHSKVHAIAYSSFHKPELFEDLNTLLRERNIEPTCVWSFIDEQPEDKVEEWAGRINFDYEWRKQFRTFQLTKEEWFVHQGDVYKGLAPVIASISGTPPTPENAANARLIAAAPQMLRALWRSLKKETEFLCLTRSKVHQTGFTRRVSHLLDAIEQATGERPHFIHLQATESGCREEVSWSHSLLGEGGFRFSLPTK